MWVDVNQVVLTGSIASDVRMVDGQYSVTLASISRWTDAQGGFHDRKAFNRVIIRPQRGGGVSRADRLKVGDDIYVSGTIEWNRKHDGMVIYAHNWSFLTRPQGVIAQGGDPIAESDVKRYTMSTVSRDKSTQDKGKR